MNWFTAQSTLRATEGQKESLLEQHGGCEHVEKDPTKMVSVRFENDSFGREGHCICEDCLDKIYEDADNKLVGCNDCGEQKKAQDVITWRWWDFYAAQGDEAIMVCHSCLSKEKHQARVSRDKWDQGID